MKKENLELVHEAARLNEWYNGSEIERVAYRAITESLNTPEPKPETKKKSSTKKKGK